MPDPRPLPRSLAPLEHEALTGYVLRLAHRLERTPARILQLTGLTAPSGFPCRAGIDLLVRLDIDTTDRFCRATGLSTNEAERLCLASLAPRFPIPLPAQQRLPKSYLVRADWWILTTTSRYCPQCLAGDASSIQQRHGGAWQLHWRLPIAFACPRHRRLLEHLCPSCQRPAQHAVRGSGGTPLIPGLQVAGLHPAQCRSSPQCGTRLDHNTMTADAVPRSVLSLQDRLLALLDPPDPPSTTSAGLPTSPARYFTDLRLLSTLIIQSWPRARGLLPADGTDTYADAIEQYARRQQECWPQPVPWTRTARVSTRADTPDPAISASLLNIADRMLNLQNPSESREQIQQLLPIRTYPYNQRGWAGHFLAYAQSICSPGLREAVTPLVRHFPRQGTRARRAPEINTNFAPEHVPQRLPDDWFDRHLAHFDGIAHHVLRRCAAIRLIQMTTGGPLGEAAHFLGLPTNFDRRGSRIYNSNSITVWAKQRRDPDEVDAAIRAIGQELDKTFPLINYRRRREALRDWSITPAQWHAILEENHLQPQPEDHTGLHLTDWERQNASTLVWALVTHGEETYAPQPLRDQQPADIQTAWRAQPQWHCWSPLTHPDPRYLALKATLHAYAANLRAQIDTTGQPDLSMAN